LCKQVTNLESIYGSGKTNIAAPCSTGSTVGWVDIGIGTKVPLRFIAYLSKVTKINVKSVLTQ
jgi:hypothetical protein